MRRMILWMVILSLAVSAVAAQDPVVGAAADVGTSGHGDNMTADAGVIAGGNATAGGEIRPVAVVAKGASGGVADGGNAAAGGEIRPVAVVAQGAPGGVAAMMTADGKSFELRMNGSVPELRSAGAHANVSLKLMAEHDNNTNGTLLRANLSNGRFAEIKVMPDTASATAIARLKLKVCSSADNCTIELKEVGSGNATTAAYDVHVQEKTKVFGIFSADMPVQAQVDASTGAVIAVKRPWWSFLAVQQSQ